jgi:hypothetical protein
VAGIEYAVVEQISEACGAVIIHADFAEHVIWHHRCGNVVKGQRIKVNLALLFSFAETSDDEGRSERVASVVRTQLQEAQVGVVLCIAGIGAASLTKSIITSMARKDLTLGVCVALVRFRVIANTAAV